MPRVGRLTVAVVSQKLDESMGNISAVARALHVTRSSVYSFIENHPVLKERLKDARESLIDAAESVLYKCILKEEGWAVCFTLKTQGKSRGYIEREKIDPADLAAICKVLLVGKTPEDAPTDPPFNPDDA